MTDPGRKLIIAAAALAAATFAGARGASAFVCANTSDTTTECKQLRACAKELMVQASSYGTKMQALLIGSIDTNLQGKNKDADGGKRCVTNIDLTTKDFIGKACFASKGACKDGARKNLACDEDFDDCPGFCKNNPQQICWVDHPDCNPSTTFDRNVVCVKPGLGVCKMLTGFATTDSCSADAECAAVPNSTGVCVNAGVGCLFKAGIGCNPGECMTGGAPCTISKDCGASGPCIPSATTDLLCEINQGKGVAGAFAAQAAAVRKKLKAKCPDPADIPAPAFSVDLAELGLPTDLCKGTCSGSFNQCSPSKPCTGVGAGDCIFSRDDAASCITQAAAGDLLNAVVAEVISRPIGKMAFNVQPMGVKEVDAVAPRIPRKVSNLSLPSVIQIGARSDSDGAGSAGGSAPLGMARCRDSGALDGSPCTKDADCVRGGVKKYKAGGVTDIETALCVPDCCECTGAGTCTNLDTGTPSNVTGGRTPNAPAIAAAQCLASDVAGSCVGNKCVGSRRAGLPCDTAADCPASIICETRGNSVPPGNILTTTENKANFISSCLLTKTGRVSHLTTGLDASDKGTCKVSMADCTADADCGVNGPCEGGLAQIGTVNLNTGDSTSSAPINTEVYLGSGASGEPCPHCVADGGSATKFSCDSGANAAGMCLGPVDGSTDEACPPDGTWTQIPGVPNPFNLKTGKTQMTEGSGGGADEFCGYCSLAESTGCSLDGVTQPCPSGLGSCASDAGVNNKGFRGSDTYDDDAVVASQQATAQGVADVYLPVMSGVFCTGKVSPLVDGSIGLPGPVRVIQPFLRNYTFTP
jgi:hypothetical protein